MRQEHGQAPGGKLMLHLWRRCASARLALVSPKKYGRYGLRTEKPAQPIEKAFRASCTCKGNAAYGTS